MNLLLRFSLIILIFKFTIAPAQNPYQKGWQALNNADVDNAIKFFEQARKNNSLKENSLLCLTLLYSQNNREKDASECFEEYFNISKDPYPALFALWFEEGVIGHAGKKKPHQQARLEKINNDSANKGKLDGGTLYRLGTSKVMSFDKEGSKQYFNQLNYLNDWSVLGPFDNVMNSGFDKDVGAVSNPGANSRFISKYGSEVSWFDPPLNIYDAYFFKDMYFQSANSIIYAQAFVEAEREEDYILKFGYSGSLKVWVNDSLIYTESENRETEMDYYRFKCKLNKGYNRILVQLGDYNESYSNFTMRLTDTEHNPVKLPQSTQLQQYQKQLLRAEQIPFFSVEALEKKVKEDDDLVYKFLLVKAYLRSKQIYEAEEILEAIYAKEPKNFFVLRNFVLLYEKASDNTNQNKFYQLFKETYPEDINILLNDLADYRNEGNKSKYKNAVTAYLEKYPNHYDKMYYEMVVSDMYSELEKTLALIDTLYTQYPDDYTAVTTKYDIERNYYSRPETANKLLEKYLEENYSYNIVNELVGNYVNEGLMDKAVQLLERNIDMVNSSSESYSYL
ncbi:MAG: tetratricopeptide repeat protein, partial [Bacteroidia bacterium]